MNRNITLGHSYLFQNSNFELSKTRPQYIEYSRSNSQFKKFCAATATTTIVWIRICTIPYKIDAGIMVLIENPLPLTPTLMDFFFNSLFM